MCWTETLQHFRTVNSTTQIRLRVEKQQEIYKLDQHNNSHKWCDLHVLHLRSQSFLLRFSLPLRVLFHFLRQLSSARVQPFLHVHQIFGTSFSGTLAEHVRSCSLTRGIQLKTKPAITLYSGIVKNGTEFNPGNAVTHNVNPHRAPVSLTVNRWPCAQK